MGRFSVIQLSLLVSSHCMSIATHHIRIVSDSILPPKKYSPKIYMAMEKPTIWKCMCLCLLKNGWFSSLPCWTNMEGDACLSCLFTNSEPGGFETPDVQEENTQLSFESGKKNKNVFVGLFKRPSSGVSSDSSPGSQRYVLVFIQRYIPFRNMTCPSLNQKNIHNDRNTYIHIIPSNKKIGSNPINPQKNTASKRKTKTVFSRFGPQYSKLPSYTSLKFLTKTQRVSRLFMKQWVR